MKDIKGLPLKTSFYEVAAFCALEEAAVVVYSLGIICVESFVIGEQEDVG